VGILFGGCRNTCGTTGLGHSGNRRLQESFGSDVVNDNLRDLVSSQAGAMCPSSPGALSRLIGGRLRAVSTCSP